MTIPRRGLTLKFLSDVIPAESGYFVVTSGPNKELTGYEALRTHVLAWALEKGTFQPYPVTLDGIAQGAFSILLPNGAVECIGRDEGQSLTYHTLSQWLEAEKQFFFEAKS